MFCCSDCVPGAFPKVNCLGLLYRMGCHVRSVACQRVVRLREVTGGDKKTCEGEW